MSHVQPNDQTIDYLLVLEYKFFGRLVVWSSDALCMANSSFGYVGLSVIWLFGNEIDCWLFWICNWLFDCLVLVCFQIIYDYIYVYVFIYIFGRHFFFCFATSENFHHLKLNFWSKTTLFMFFFLYFVCTPKNFAKWKRYLFLNGFIFLQSQSQ